MEDEVAVLAVTRLVRVVAVLEHGVVRRAGVRHGHLEVAQWLEERAVRTAVAASGEGIPLVTPPAVQTVLPLGSGITWFELRDDVLFAECASAWIEVALGVPRHAPHLAARRTPGGCGHFQLLVELEIIRSDLEGSAALLARFLHWASVYLLQIALLAIDDLGTIGCIGGLHLLPALLTLPLPECAGIALGEPIEMPSKPVAAWNWQIVLTIEGELLRLNLERSARDLAADRPVQDVVRRVFLMVGELRGVDRALHLRRRRFLAIPLPPLRAHVGFLQRVVHLRGCLVVSEEGERRWKKFPPLTGIFHMFDELSGESFVLLLRVLL